MTHNTDIWKTAVEVFHVLLKRTLLARRTRLLRGLAVFGYTAGIHDMTADGIIAGHAVGDFPRVHVRVFVVVHQAFHAAIQMEQVSISDLFPAAPAL